MPRQPPKPIAKPKKRRPRLRREGLGPLHIRIRHKRRIRRPQRRSPQFTRQNLRQRTQLMRLLLRPRLLLM
jgi:hypothetical protein